MDLLGMFLRFGTKIEPSDGGLMIKPWCGPYKHILLLGIKFGFWWFFILCFYCTLNLLFTDFKRVLKIIDLIVVIRNSKVSETLVNNANTILKYLPFLCCDNCILYGSLRCQWGCVSVELSKTFVNLLLNYVKCCSKRRGWGNNRGMIFIGNVAVCFVKWSFEPDGAWTVIWSG